MKIMPIFIIFLGMISSAFSMEETQSVATNETSLTAGGYFTSHNEKTSDWLKLEPFTFEHHSERKNTTSINSFFVGNVFRPNWGTIALYPHDVSPEKIRYSYGSFSDLGKGTACFLSTLKYEYVPQNELYPAYLIVEKVITSIDDNGAKLEGKGYSQACLKYFVDEFVTNHTKIKYVFSDLRNPVCTMFFPKYNFQSGLPEELKGIQFTRPMQRPYFWQNPHL